MNSSLQDIVLFHYSLARSAISLPGSLFAAQVHHLMYVGIFKQFLPPENFVSSLEPQGFLLTSQAPSYLSLLFFYVLLICAHPHTSLFCDKVSHTVFYLPPKLHSENIIPCPFPPFLSLFQTSSSFATYQQS